MKKILLIALLFVSIIGSSQTVRKYSNEFMNIGVDAAALGMSNAVVATTGDVNSGYWNPAGLLKVEERQVALMHASYFANIAQYDYAAFATKIDDQSAWGISLIRFGVDDILNTTQLIDNQGNIDYNRISLFSTADYGLTFSYVRKMKLEGFKYGVNAKVIRRIIGKFASSWGFGFDLGFQFDRDDWHYGLMLRDITTTYNVWAINEDEFNKIKDAVAGQNQDLPEVNLNMQFAQTNDLISTSAVSIDPAIGFEFGYTELVFLRAGVGNFQNVEQLDGSTKVNFQPNIGLGFKFKGVQIDYALTDLGDQSAALYSNIFSVKVDLSIFR